MPRLVAHFADGPKEEKEDPPMEAVSSVQSSDDDADDFNTGVSKVYPPPVLSFRQAAEAQVSRVRSDFANELEGLVAILIMEHERRQGALEARLAELERSASNSLERSASNSSFRRVPSNQPSDYEHSDEPINTRLLCVKTEPVVKLGSGRASDLSSVCSELSSGNAPASRRGSKDHPHVVFDTQTWVFNMETDVCASEPAPPPKQRKKSVVGVGRSRQSKRFAAPVDCTVAIVPAPPQEKPLPAPRITRRAVHHILTKGDDEDTSIAKSPSNLSVGTAQLPWDLAQLFFQ